MFLITATVVQCIGRQCDAQLGSVACEQVATGKRLTDGKCAHRPSRATFPPHEIGSSSVSFNGPESQSAGCE